ncbi:MAG: hypothetical protein U0263_34710 [Polyangiaceae bacterium]
MSLALSSSMIRGAPWGSLPLVLLTSACGSNDAAPEQPSATPECPSSLGCELLVTSDGTLGASPVSTCFLSALRDRKVGRYESGVIDESSVVYQRFWLVDAATTEVMSGVGHDDASVEYAPSRRVELAAPSHFQACLAATDDQARFACFSSAIAAELGTPGRCP